MKIVIVRHGPAKDIEKGQDISRELTTAGTQVVPNLGEFDKVFSSPAERCIATAKLSTGGQEPSIIESLSTHLWDKEVLGSPGWELIERCYYNKAGELQEVPLSKIVLSEEEEEAWESLTADAMNSMFYGCGDQWKSVLICSHQFHCQKIALEILEEQGSSELKEFIRNMYLPPGGSFTLNVQESVVLPFRGRRGGIFFWKKGS